MRKLVRRMPFSQTLRASTPEYRPEVHEQKFKSWWTRLNSLSSKPTSKVYLAQLSNLFAFYNRQVDDTVKVVLLLFSPLTSMLGEQRSLPLDLSIRFRRITRTLLLRSTTFTECLTVSSPRTPKQLTKSYHARNIEQRDGLPHRNLAH